MKFRHECKHRINNIDLMLLQKRLSSVLERDKFADENGLYLVKSLYFDNYKDKILKEKLDGTDKREKFRIRYYNNDTSFIRLEKKCKIGGLCTKENAVLPKEQCEKILCGDTSFLINSPIPLFNELYAKMRYQLLRPKIIVAYQRECFVYKPGNVRITLDTEIRGSYSTSTFLTPDTSFTKLSDTAVLEIKWDEYLPDIIRDLTQLKARKTSSFSKYAAVRF